MKQSKSAVIPLQNMDKLAQEPVNINDTDKITNKDN